MNQRILDIADFADSPELKNFKLLLEIRDNLDNSEVIAKLDQVMQAVLNNEPIIPVDYSDEFKKLADKFEELKPLLEEKDEEIEVSVEIV